MRVLLTGASGQLGSEIQRARLRLGRDAWDLVPLDHVALDVTRPRATHRTVVELRPDVVINTAALVRVDDCERLRLKALRVNAGGAAALAGACAEAGAVLVQVSTDYVFDGRATAPYAEDDLPRPVNFYGVAKLRGEQVVRGRLPDDHLIVRTSGLFGTPMDGRPVNFVSHVLERARGGDALRVVDDQVCSPTSAADLAAVILRLVDVGARGTVHVTNRGECSWYEFACACLGYAGVSEAVLPISSESLAAPAARPAYSVLANTRLAALGIEQPRPWQEALREYVAAYQAGAT